MSLTISLTPTEEARLSAAATKNGIAPEEFARKLVTDHLPVLPAEPGMIDEENARAIALLDKWIQEDATDDPEEIRQAEEELAEFKRNMNANRAATGERLAFPI